MTYIIPTGISLSVIRTVAEISLCVEGDTPRSSERFDLVLRASSDTNIVLSTGHRLADVDIHLMLSTEWRTAQELDRDLTISDVGFLTHTLGERGEPFVHGIALLFNTNTAAVASLLYPGVSGKVRLGLPTVPFEDRKDAPYVWGRNRPYMLRISHLALSVIRDGETRSDSY
jgi:hypothetical protein